MRITILGCGNMGSAIAKRLSVSNELFLIDRNPEKSKKLEIEGHGKVLNDLNEAIDQSDLIVLAIKPQSLDELKGVFQKEKNQNKILLSILTGTTIDQLKSYFPFYQIVRMMPNLAVAYGDGLVALVADKDLDSKKCEAITKLCDSLGHVLWLTENKIDAFTALAGSGPAYVFSIVEAMTEAGIAMGLNAKLSQSIVHQMIRGSLTVLEESSKHPAELKWQVSSPAGTTIAGIIKYEEAAVSSGIINTFIACYKRAQELSKGNHN